MALLNITFIVADNATARKDIFLDLLVLRHRSIDSRILLEQKWVALDGMNCFKNVT